MDGSFLSDAAVIRASRSYVCIRLATYENKTEQKFLRGLNGLTGSNVNNTTFTILTPNGKHALLWPSRSPRFNFGTARRLVASMQKTLKDYPRRKPATAETMPLPKAANVRLGLNIAASDNLPLVLIVGRDAKELQQLEAAVNRRAWSESHIGRFIYASTTDRKALAAIKGTKRGSGVSVVQPGQFGLKGTVLSHVSATDVGARLTASLGAGARKFRPKPKSSVFGHIRNGASKGVFWKTLLPVTDPMEARARERTQRQINRRR